MRELVVDASEWQTSDDVFAALLAALGAPRWHGRNLDALADPLTGGDLNAVNPPFRVSVTGLRGASAEAQATARSIAALFTELAAAGHEVFWSAA